MIALLLYLVTIS